MAGLDGVLRALGPSRWLASRTARERLLLAGALVTGLAALGYDRLWQPLVAARVETTSEINRLSEAMARVRAAGPLAATGGLVETLPPQKAVAMSAPKFGLSIQRVEPEGQRTSVVLENAEFENLLKWLVALQSEHGLGIAGIDVERRPEPGLVSARLVLER